MMMTVQHKDSPIKPCEANGPIMASTVAILGQEAAHMATVDAMMAILGQEAAHFKGLVHGSLTFHHQSIEI